MNKVLLYGGVALAAIVAVSYAKSSPSSSAPADNGLSGYYSPLSGLTGYAPLSSGMTSTGANASSSGSASSDALAGLLREKYKTDAQVSLIQSVLNAITALWQTGNGTDLKGSILVGDYPIAFDLSGGGNYAYAGNPMFVPPIGQANGATTAPSLSNQTIASLLEWLQSAGTPGASTTPGANSSPALTSALAIPGAMQGALGPYISTSIPNPNDTSSSIPVYYSPTNSLSNGAIPAPIDPSQVNNGNPLFVGSYTVGFLPDGSFQYADGSTLPAPSYVVPSNYQGFGVDDNGNPVGWD